jgi:F-type H+-transporting ATPase subunit c
MKLNKLMLGMAPVAALLGATPALAETGATATNSYGPLGAGLVLGLAAIGGAFGQGRTAAAALEGMARNPQAKLLVPMIVGLALIESLVIYALIVAMKLSG